MINQTENHFLDISKLLSGETDRIDFDLAGLDFPFEENQITVSSLHFSGCVIDLSGFLRLSGTVTGQYSASCARCLAPVDEEFSLEIDLPVETAEAETEEEVIAAEGHQIDLAALCEETVFTNLPFRLLCREDCKGLCPKCGKVLNDGDCGCVQKETDPRLAGLADFFKD
ncbi:MAG: DUF177 domain-containing protein [Clostridia bacterium]|nr:DUF177 domain-containing protein [Clostridia bacterium]